MPISRKILPPRLPEVGKIKIGGKGEKKKSRQGNEFRLPIKFDYFLITHNRRDDNDDLIPYAEVMEQLPPKPIELDVMLLYDDIELSFPNNLTWYKGRTRMCTGNGEVAERLNEDTGELEQMDCPCDLLKPDKAGNTKCKPTGRLSVLLPHVKGVGGVFVFRTHGWNSVGSIQSSLEFIQTLTGGVLAGIPLKMKLHTKTGERPDGTPQQVHYVSIEYSGTPGDLRMQALEVAQSRASSQIETARLQALAEHRVKALRSGELDAAETDADIVEEYYPDQQPGHVDEVENPDPVDRKRRTNPVTGSYNLGTTEPKVGEKILFDGVLKVYDGASWISEEEWEARRAEDEPPLEDGDVSMADMAKEAAKVQGYKDLMNRVVIHFGDKLEPKQVEALWNYLSKTEKKRKDLAALIKAWGLIMSLYDPTYDKWGWIGDWSEHEGLRIGNEDNLASAPIDVLRIVQGKARKDIVGAMDMIELSREVNEEIVDPEPPDEPTEAISVGTELTSDKLLAAIDGANGQRFTKEDKAAVRLFIDGDMPETAWPELYERMMKLQK